MPEVTLENFRVWRGAMIDRAELASGVCAAWNGDANSV